MAELEENKVSGVYGGAEFSNTTSSSTSTEAGTIRTNNNNALVKNGFWDKFKAFWLQDIDWNTEITVELTPYQQKIEDEINAFLHQEITWSKIRSVFSRK